MNQTVKMLEDILGREVEVYTNALEYAKKKQQALIKGDTEAIEAIVHSEEKLLGGIKELELSREKLITDAAGEMALAAHDLTLKTLAAKIGGAQGISLLKKRTQLRHVIAQLADYNEQNRALIETHMKYTAFCMELLTGGMNSTNTYTNTGEASEEKASKHLLFDQKA